MKMLALACLIAAGSCAPSWKDAPHPTLYQKANSGRSHTKPPSGWSVSDWWDFGLHTVVVPLAKSLSPGRWVAAVAGNKPALDVNAFGKVPDSEWFVNRITRTHGSPNDLVRGPNREGPPPDGRLVVLSGKTEGNTPGLVLRDVSGAVWFVKFDPPAFRQLSTNAELIASKFLHAAGYWVPETYVLQLDVSRLQLGKGAWTRDDYNRKIPLRKKQLTELIALMNPNKDGRLRTLFSRSVPGEALGPFSYRGVRVGDPNDRIPHQRRRSLRGLWVFSAWLNNTDIRRQNTVDTFIAPKGKKKGLVRHYLIDFGDSLGAAGDREKYKGEGYEARVDWSEVAKRGFALGLYYPYWLGLQRTPFRSVGIFEADVFDPARWYPVVENPAFEEAEPEDTFWGVSILSHFTEDRIRAVVEHARYTEAGAADYIVEVLAERRKKLLLHGFSSMLGIDEPTVVDGYTLRFLDLEALGGVRKHDGFVYQVRWNRAGARDVVVGSGRVRGAPVFDLREDVRAAMLRGKKEFEGDPFLTVEIRGIGRRPAVIVELRVVRDFLLPVSLRRIIRFDPARSRKPTRGRN